MTCSPLQSIGSLTVQCLLRSPTEFDEPYSHVSVYSIGFQPNCHVLNTNQKYEKAFLMINATY